MSEYRQTMLYFDWEDVEYTTISAIVGEFECRMNSGAESWGNIAIVLGEKYVVLSVNEDTDEIILNITNSLPAGKEWVSVTSMSEAIGQRIGWCWEGRNYRGYLDTFTIGIPNLIPRYMFLGLGSAIRILRLDAL